MTPSAPVPPGRKSTYVALAAIVLAGLAAAAYLLLTRPAQPNLVRNPPAATAAARTFPWAQPIQRPGLPNLHQVSPQLYRGAQPAREGMGELVKMGVKTVVNLRATSSDRSTIGKAPLAYERIWSNPWHAEEEDLVRFLKIATDPARTPVFVHCNHGADRTGLACAVYRVAVQDWPKEEAIREMTEGGFGFHQNFQNLVEFLRDLDVAKIRREAGLATAPANQTP